MRGGREGVRRLVGALQVARSALGVRVTLQGWRDRWESAQEEARQRDVRRVECRARWLQGHPELAARAVQVKRMRGACRRRSGGVAAVEQAAQGVGMVI